MAITNRKKDDLDWVYPKLNETSKEDEVRLIVCDILGISLLLRLLGSTDGYWNQILFEFKFDKKFCSSGSWNKTAYQTLAQALFYCRKIVENQVDGIDQLPHTIAICDKNGGFLINTELFETVLAFNPATFSSSIENLSNELESLLGNDYRALLEEFKFSWDSPPSSQEEGLVAMLEKTKILERVNYYDFSKAGQLKVFIESIKDSEGKIPQIPITKNNFIPIFEKWFSAFAPKEASRRDWADKYIMDLRVQYKLDKKNGLLKSSSDSFEVPSDRYEDFWKLYRRPPEESVDRFIATNKDLLFDLKDQNNHGDFYTPIRVASMAQALIFKYISEKNEPKRCWWDPAAGGGNLFFKFSNAKSILLSTKFDNDVAGLKANSSVDNQNVFQIDFINDLIEKDKAHSKVWKKISANLESKDELVFFLNPPFDDQAESGGSNQSLPDGFFDEVDAKDVSARALRAMHTRFLYRILSLARVTNKRVVVAIFSKTGWLVGPDSQSFYQKWSKNFGYKDGFIISSKVFNGVKEEWPCMFSIWEYNPGREINDQLINQPKVFDVFDKDYNWTGKKTLVPFTEDSVRLSELAKLDRKLKKSMKMVDVVPLMNEYEVSNIVYEDQMPENSLGYIRLVANDVYNSTQRVQITSSMFGPSNHNGSPITEQNFLQALAVYGIRKCVRRTWLNDKDEFYFPKNPSKEHEKLLVKAAVYALVDGGYASSMNKLKYKSKTFSFRNSFFICSPLEVTNWGGDGDFTEPYAVKWLKTVKNDLDETSKQSLAACKAFIRESFQDGNRAKGDTKRQVRNGDAGIRQLINGLLEFEGVKLTAELSKAYKKFLDLKECLRKELEQEVYRLAVLLPFEESTPIKDAAAQYEELTRAAVKLQKSQVKPRLKKSRKSS